MWEIVALLREHGIAVRLLRSKNPGKIVYEGTTSKSSFGSGNAYKACRKT